MKNQFLFTGNESNMQYYGEQKFGHPDFANRAVVWYLFTKYSAERL